jgi:uncharacterized membrane protein (UPF0127 family)
MLFIKADGTVESIAERTTPLSRRVFLEGTRSAMCWRSTAV